MTKIRLRECVLSMIVATATERHDCVCFFYPGDAVWNARGRPAGLAEEHSVPPLHQEQQTNHLVLAGTVTQTQTCTVLFCFYSVAVHVLFMFRIKQRVHKLKLTDVVSGSCRPCRNVDLECVKECDGC